MRSVITRQEWQDMEDACWQNGKAVIADVSKTQYFRMHVEFLYDKDNVHNCEFCPYKRSVNCTGRCWVVAHIQRGSGIE